MFSRPSWLNSTSFSFLSNLKTWWYLRAETEHACPHLSKWDGKMCVLLDYWIQCLDSAESSRGLSHIALLILALDKTVWWARQRPRLMFHNSWVCWGSDVLAWGAEVFWHKVGANPKCLSLAFEGVKHFARGNLLLVFCLCGLRP